MKQMFPGAPSSWLAYVIVDDVKGSTAKAKSLGANMMKGVRGKSPAWAGSPSSRIRPAPPGPLETAKA